MGKILDTSAMKYQRDFLRFNKISQVAFGRIFVTFMKTHPTEVDYRRFAGKYSIHIADEPEMPSRLCAMLSVNINAIKVLAGSESEAETAIEEIMSQVGLGKELETDD